MPLRFRFFEFVISIHALLAESDRPSAILFNGRGYFYPRSPCGERRVHYDNYNLHCVISIHALLAESDSPASVTPAASRNFYPRSPCGERHPQVTMRTWQKVFLSTLSLRRATPTKEEHTMKKAISIHALLAESDSNKCSKGSNDSNFYPRSPCGERQCTP